MKRTEELIEKRNELLVSLADKVMESIVEPIMDRRLPNLSHPCVEFGRYSWKEVISIRFSGYSPYEISSNSLRSRWVSFNPTQIREDIIFLLSVKAQWLEAFEEWNENEEIESIISILQ